MRKPGSVPSEDGDGHFSRTTIARGLKQPTRKSIVTDRDANRANPVPSFLLGLAPDGVYQATRVTSDAGELLPHRFTLTTRSP